MDNKQHYPFDFPFEPYQIQLDLMKKMYTAIEEGKVAIMESPTGTGKSLSIICAALSWLEDDEMHERGMCLNAAKELEQRFNEIEANSDWAEAEHRKMEADDDLKRLKLQVEQYERVEKRLEEARQRHKTNLQSDMDFDIEEEVDDALIMTEYGDDRDLLPSDVEDDGGELNVEDGSTSWKNNLQVGQKRKLNEADQKINCRKIIYASRTHIQLEHFIQELARTRFRPRVLTVGGRQQLCVNVDVCKLKISALINDRCKELISGMDEVMLGEGSCQGANVLKELRSKGGKLENKKKPKKKIKCNCEYARAEAVKGFADAVLIDETGTSGSVKEMVNLARHRHACAYFGARAALSACQLVLVPYNILLHARMRDAWHLSLRDNVIIVDEAHNLLKTLADVHAVEVSSAQLNMCSSLIDDYLDYFSERLSSCNFHKIRQLQTLIVAIRNFASNAFYVYPSDETVLKLKEFLTKLGNVADNLPQLIGYIKKSNLFYKLRLFSQRHLHKIAISMKKKQNTRIGILRERNDNRQNVDKQRCTNIIEEQQLQQKCLNPISLSTSLCQVREFIEIINFHPKHDACVVLKKIAQSVSDSRQRSEFVDTIHLRFVLLNPAACMNQLITETRALVLLGGTMRPTDQLMDALIRVCRVPKTHIVEFACGHVIEDSQLIALQLGKGPNQQVLNLNFSTRGSVTLLSSLALCMVNMLRHVPNGAVAFFPSYAALSDFVRYLRESGLLQQLDRVKRLFVECKTAGAIRGEQSDVWTRFCDSAISAKGALLFAVVGGTLSEGINFSDELGRCVILVGLPYANKNSFELKERMRYMDEHIGVGAGGRYYEQQCMQVVNQAIGRVIRHRADYAAIVLLDERYARMQIRDSLPKWIQRRAYYATNFQEALCNLVAFFRSHNK